ncbi:IS66 family insertion sequence element accessory protein TnpB [Megasphaera sp.]|uniref:IS66 family insertion sequence element accessory protein TnpB n=1 Tax=Megasphaera sp. TaxID=2023260 RepID=UPI0035221B85
MNLPVPSGILLRQLWQGDGFLLLYKRLEKRRMQWPRTPDEVRELTPQQYR